MSAMSMAWLVVLVLSVGVLVEAVRRDTPRVEWVAKPLASTCFVGLAWQQGVLAHPWGLAMLLGFVGCWRGDVLLIPKERRIFLAGITAFALGHVGFAVAFFLRGVDETVMGMTALALVPVALGVLRWLWPSVAGVMRVAVPAYILIICTMVAAAAGTMGLEAGGSGPGLLVGACLFWVSDLCVARERFVVSAFVNRAVGLPLYYAAVAVLAWASSSSG